MDRTKGLGGTDFAHIFNLPRYYCARRLFFEKLSVPEDYPRDRGGVLALGTALEPHVIDRYAEQRSVKRHKCSPYAPVHRAADAPEWLNGHPDGIVERRTDDYGVLECKTFGGHAWKSMLLAEGIPKPYILQLQAYLWQTGLKWAAWACLNRDTGEFLSFDVDRDERIIESLRKAGAEFWAKIERARGTAERTAPELVPWGWHDKHADDKAPCGECPWRFTCLSGKLAAEAEDVAERRKQRGDLPEVEDARLSRYMEYLDVLEAPLKRAKARVETVKQAVKDRLVKLGCPDGACVGGRRITAGEQMRSGFDTKGMLADGLDLSKYATHGAPYRSVRIGGNGGN